MDYNPPPDSSVLEIFLEEYKSSFLLPSLERIFPVPRIKFESSKTPRLQVDSLPPKPLGSPSFKNIHNFKNFLTSRDGTLLSTAWWNMQRNDVISFLMLGYKKGFVASIIDTKKIFHLVHSLRIQLLYSIGTS